MPSPARRSLASWSLLVRERGSSRGYTLIELTVALVMASIVSTAGLSAFAAFNRQRVRIERASTADDIAKTVLQYLVRESQRIGGSALRPWQAIAVEQDPCADTSRFQVPCESDGLPGERLGPDRVTFAFADEGAVFSGCTIKSMTASEITFEKPTHEDITGCCNQFRFDDDNNIVLRPLGDFKHEHIMLSSTGFGGTSEEVYKAVTYKTAPGGADCTFNYIESGQAFPLASIPRPGPSAFASDPASTSLLKRQANAIPIKIATAFVGCPKDTDCDAHPEERALFLFSDRNAGASTTARDEPGDDNFPISPNVVDLQVALGYDNDEDGEVVESESGENDDFAGNASSSVADTGFSTATASLASASETLTDDDDDDDDDDEDAPAPRTDPNPRLLRMIRIGVVGAVKVNDSSYQTSAQLPGGGVHDGAGLHLRAISSKAAFRSLNLLE